MRRLVREAAADDAAEGSRWLEIQVDPTSYAPFVGGITPALEIVLDEARTVSARGRHRGGRRRRGEPHAPPARGAHARPARGPVRRRRRGRRSSASGCRTTSAAGSSPTSGRRSTSPGGRARARAARRRAAGRRTSWRRSTRPRPGPDRARRARAPRTPLLDARRRAGVALEVCPLSNIGLGVYGEAAEVPLRTLVDAGARVALGADDPLLFGSRLATSTRSRATTASRTPSSPAGAVVDPGEPGAGRRARGGWPTSTRGWRRSQPASDLVTTTQDRCRNRTSTGSAATGAPDGSGRPTEFVSASVRPVNAVWRDELVLLPAAPARPIDPRPQHPVCDRPSPVIGLVAPVVAARGMQRGVAGDGPTRPPPSRHDRWKDRRCGPYAAEVLAARARSARPRVGPALQADRRASA